MKYAVTHRTWYAYAEPAPVCHNLVHLAPRDSGRQICRDHRLAIDPEPAFTARRVDYFGNLVDYFSIEATHSGLELTATSTVEVAPPPKLAAVASPPWDQVARHRARGDAEELLAYHLALPSPRIAASPQLVEYARPSFTPGRPIVEAVADLGARIHADFTFDPKATTVHTPLAELLEIRRGVCQDFAHLAIGCVRSMGLSARYVSGYLRTVPPPGKPRLVGADASHAWLAVWCGPLGWIDFDPTNNSLASDGHISIAWGRDYGDVAPIQGVFVGGGEHRMGVSVDVLPLE
jgi:transglutaminase-like putative cysteine protease